MLRHDGHHDHDQQHEDELVEIAEGIKRELECQLVLLTIATPDGAETILTPPLGHSAKDQHKDRNRGAEGEGPLRQYGHEGNAQELHEHDRQNTAMADLLLRHFGRNRRSTALEGEVVKLTAVYEDAAAYCTQGGGDDDEVDDRGRSRNSQYHEDTD